MAGESGQNKRRWSEEDEQWARISRNRDFGAPLNYDEAAGTCEGEEVCGEEAWMRRSSPESQTRPRYPRIFDPARIDFERSRRPFDAAKETPRSEGQYGYERYPLQHKDMREEYLGMGRMMCLWEQGPYSGRGPKGYHRSDQRIQEDVCEALTMDGWVDANKIEVSVEKGDVTLNGVVPERAMKRYAEDAVIGIPGVRDVHNRLNVEETGEKQPPAPPVQQRPRLQEGMDVRDLKGNFIGRIKAVRESDFLVDRSMARDLYVPNSTVKSAENQIVLNVDEGQLESMDLPKPDVF